MYITRDAEHIAVPWRDDLKQVIPHARELNRNGERLLVMPNRSDEIKVARNLGLPLPAPILSRYNWRGGTPWETQRTTAALLSESGSAYCLNEFGTGKTRSCIWAADYLRQTGQAKRVLICAPLSTLSPVWVNELFRVIPSARVQLLHGSKAERLRRLAEDADFYVVNHHGLKILKNELIARGFDIFILDELATFRNRRTGLWKAAKAIVTSGVKYCWGLTGSPTPKAPTDAWAQVKLLTPERTTHTFTRFQDLTMRQVSTFRWVRKPEAGKIVHEMMQPSVRFALSDVTELPPTTYLTREIELEDETKRAYKLMVDRMRIMTKNGEDITAANEGVLQSKLLQVSMGYLYTDAKGVYELPNESRIDVVREIVESTSRKVIVFCPFIHALEGLAAELQKVTSIAVVHGKTPIGVRNKIFTQFQSDAEDPHCIIAHPACMAHGLTLTQANTIVWFGPTNNFEVYEQANARIIRPGQTSKTMVVHVVATPVEKLAYRRLQERGSFQGFLLELFRQQDFEF